MKRLLLSFVLGVSALVLVSIITLSASAQGGAAAVLNEPSDTWIVATDPITKFVVLTWKTFASPGVSIDYIEIWHQYNGGSWTRWISTTDTFAIYNWTATFNKDGLYGLEARAFANGVLEPSNVWAEQTVVVNISGQWRRGPYLPLVMR